MQTAHPITSLRETLEAARLELVQKIAAGGAPAVEDLSQLAVLQGSLTAVREEIEAREPKVGFGGEKGLE
jgi:hypothetical protein